MRGLFCLFGVVFTALWSGCSGGCGRQLCCGCGCVDRLAGVGSVMCWCVPAPMVGRAVLVCGPTHCGVCCVGLWPPVMAGRAILVRGPPHGGACCVGVRRLRSWCVVWWCLAWVVVVCWVAVAVVLFASPG